LTDRVAETNVQVASVWPHVTGKYTHVMTSCKEKPTTFRLPVTAPNAYAHILGRLFSYVTQKLLWSHNAHDGLPIATVYKQA
jgi:hypothetical protein